MRKTTGSFPKDVPPELAVFTGAGRLELVHRGCHHDVYRVRESTGGGTSLVKMTDVEAPTPHSIAILRREYGLLRDLDLSGVVHVKGLVKVGQGLAMVMDESGSGSLAERLASGAMNFQDFFEAAVPLAEVVARLQTAHIVHRNITPANILWEPESHRLTLIGFGHATPISALSAEHADPVELGAEFDGALPYLSPEQTGRTGRTIDHRTDHYALGAVFYEMLTGRPPFVGHDLLELIHAHIARQPAPLQELNPEVPKVLSDIVLKLLAKAPEERYQSAEALVYDVREARKRFSAGGIASFPLGRRDIPPALQIPDKLYGRSEELEALPQVFSRAAAGIGNCLLVTGAPGIGKTALVSRLEPLVAERKGFFVFGKCDQLARSVPYSALVQAVRALARRLLAEPDETLEPWKEQIQAAVSPNGRILVEMVPELSHIIGPQPPVQDLGPVESKNRFLMLFQSFLRVFARSEHPLALFLDDLQWADASSLDLVKQLIQEADNWHMLIVGTYRDTEVSATHPLVLALTDLRESGAPIREIRLGVLDQEQIAALLEETLGGGREKVRPLTGLLARKTAGNPFFLRQTLRFLHADGHIRFRAEQREWEWDLAAIERASITENVVALMVEAIGRLPETTRERLKEIASIGNRADLETLSTISNRPRAEIAEDLWPSLERGLLIPAQDTDGLSGASPTAVQFVHDRVQQAAYSLLSDDQKRSLHLHIGRLLLQRTPPENLEDKLFDIVDQLNRGEPLIDDANERRRLAELNLRAGRKAKASVAYDAAFAYLTFGLRFLGDDPWRVDPELSFALHAERAESAYLTGRHDMAEKIIDEALVHAPSKVARIDLYSLRALAATDAGDYARALELGREGLELFGLEWPREQLPDAIEAEATAVMENVGERRIEALAQEPEVADEETRGCMRLLSILGPPAYFSFEYNVLQFVMMRLVNLSLLRGPSAYSAYGYTFYGALHNRRTGDYETGHAFGRLALALARRFGHRGEESRTLEVFGLIVNPWKAPLRSNVALFKEGYRAGIESGELQYAAYNLHALLINGLSLGVPLPEFLKDIEASLEFATKHKNKTMVEFTLPFRQGVRNLTGQTRSCATFDDNDFEEARFFDEAKDQQTALAFYWVIRLQAAYLFGDYEDARNYSEAAKKVLASAMGMVIEAEHVLYTALTLAAVYGTAREEERSGLMAELEVLKGKLTTWAKHCPKNFRHKERLVEAEIARLKGAPWEALRFYNEAVEAARAEGFVQDEALANELAGRLLLADGQLRLGSRYLWEARDGYQRWGAVAKVGALERAYPDLASRKASLGTGIPAPNQEVALDTLGLIKASQAISAETVPERLFERILRIVVEVAGAQKGTLLLSERGMLNVRAHVTEEGVTTFAQGTPLNESPDLPSAILRYAARVREPLVLSDAKGEGQFAADSVVQARGIRSALAVPLSPQAEVVGLLYLENNAMRDAFTMERVEVVRVLAAQAAISLENSLLLAERERSASALRETNAELERRLAEIEKANLEIQNSRRAALNLMEDAIQSQEALRRNQERLTLSQEAGKIGTFEWNIQTNVTVWTPELEALYGLPPGGFGGMYENWRQAVHPEDRDRAEAEVMRAVKEQAELNNEFRIIRRDGEVRWIYARGKVFYDAGGRPLRMIGINMDITDRKHAEEALKQKTAEAEEASRIKSQFVSNVSHELRTPLNAIIGYSALLCEEVYGPLSQEQKEPLEGIQRNAANLLHLINDVLDLSRIEAGKLPIYLEPLNVEMLMKEVVAAMKPLLKGKELEIQWNIPKALPPIESDAGKVTQIFTNLLSNAIKFTSKGEITVSADDRPEKKGVEIGIEDTGIGIKPEELTKIFEAFHQSDAGLTRKFEGVGLGLAIVKDLVHLLRGEIAVQSRYGKGSVFTIFLPYRLEQKGAV